MDHRITQCPRCGTSFRVTEAHLAVAAGAVRCGSCLHIFNAREHWADPTPPAPEKIERPLAAKQIEDIEIDDDALFDDETPIFDDEPAPAKTNSGSIFNPADDDFGIIDDGGPEKISETFLELNSWEEDSGHSFGSDADAETAEEDTEEWTQQLLDDEDEKTASTLNAPARSAVFEDFDDILDEVPEIAEHEDKAPTRPATATATNNEFSEEFLNLDADYSNARASQVTAAKVSAAHKEIVLESMRADSGINNANERHLFGLSGLEQEPLQLHQFVHEPRWPKILWRFGLVAAIALGVGQYIYFNFDALARGNLRPYLAQACAIVGCVLPPQSDISQIRTNSLIVRSHPTHRGALAVDAIINNQADFPQPYPPLQLQFSDLNGAPVAGRRFTPEEYLSGELTGSRLMPLQQPVHIALELVDPGPRAVNYLLTVAAPEAAP